MQVEVAVLHMGWIRHETALALMAMLCDPRHHVLVCFSSSSPQASNHNLAVKRFLERQPPSDFLMIMGDDAAPMANLLDLVDEDLDIVGFPHPVGRWKTSPAAPIQWNIVLTDEDGQEISAELDTARGTIEVEGIGSGAMLIARRVLEHPALRAPFLDLYDEDGVKTVSEDLNFCRRAREAGFKVYAALGHLCGHIKEVDLATIWALLRGQTQGAGYYDNLYRHHVERPDVLHRIEARMKPAAEHVVGSVLDLGCGLGQMANMVSGAYVGIDFSPFAIEWARERNRNPSAFFFTGDIRELPDAWQADTVLLLEVLEHLEDREAVARTALWMARRRVVVTVPVDMPDPAHVKPRWSRGDLEALFGELSVCQQIGRYWLAVREVQ